MALPVTVRSDKGLAPRRPPASISCSTVASLLPLPNDSVDKTKFWNLGYIYLDERLFYEVKLVNCVSYRRATPLMQS